MFIVHVNKGDSMSVTVMWDNEDQTVIRFNFESPWTWAEQQQAIDQANPMVESVTWTVDFICDVTNGPQVPLGYPMKYLRLTAERLPKNAGATIIVGASGPLRALLIAILKVFANLKPRIIFASSLEAAYEFLAERKNNDRGYSR